MAEGQGFEPWVPLDTPVFKTGAFDRSATPPKVFLVVSSLKSTEVHFEAEPRKRAGDYTVVLFTHKGEIPRINLPVTTHFYDAFFIPFNNIYIASLTYSDLRCWRGSLLGRVC